MPILELSEDDILPGVSEYEMQASTDPTFTEVNKAMFDTSLMGELGGAVARMGTTYEPDDDYDVFDDLQGYEPYADKFIGVESRREAADLKRRIDDDLQARDTIAAGSGLEVVGAAVAQMAIDPLTLIPVGGTAWRTYRTGGRILEGAAKTAGAGFGVSVAEEAALQNLQEVRPMSESVTNVAATTLLSGLLGGASGAISSRIDMADLARRLDDELTVPVPGVSTVGAKAVNDTTLDQEGLVSALGVEKVVAFQDPVMRTLNSPSRITRQYSEQIAETYLYKNKNQEGIASEISIENLVKSYNLPKYQTFKDVDDLFLAYRNSSIKNQFAGKVVTKASDVFGKARKDGKMTYHEFGEAVVRAARRGDQDPVPEVAKAAEALRARLFDPLFKRGVDVGIFEEGMQVTTAPSYVTRLYDRARIMADLPGWKAKNEQWMRQRRDEAIAELEKARIAKANDASNALADRIGELEKRASQMDEEISNVVDELTNRILSTPAGRLPYDMKLKAQGGGAGEKGALRGAARERVYDIPDAMIEDFLVNDLDAIVESYTRSLASDIELTRKFGTVDYTDVLKRIEEDYSRLSKGADAKTAAKLKESFDKDVRDISAMWERIRGTYGLPDDYAGFLPTAERTVMNWNYMRMLGGMTISAFTDIARPVMAHGLGGVYKDGVRGMVKNFKAFREASEDVKQTGTALDMVLNTRARALAGMDDHVGFSNRLEGVVGAAANGFGVVSLMSPWNSSMKQFSGVLTQNAMLRTAQDLAAGRAVAPGRVTNLAANFIDKDMAGRISEQFKKFGREVDGVSIPNAQAWDDVQAQTVFRAAVRREVDGIIVTPGQDKPLWMSRPGVRLLGQFKSFAFASVQRTMLSGLQRRDMAAMNGAALSLFLGMGVYATKEAIAGRELSDDWRIWVSEGIDRSGLTGWAFDANNIVEKVSRGRIGVNALVGGPQMSRYASRSALEAAFGPTYGLIGDSVGIAGSAISGEWTASDTAAVRKLMPYQNLFYLRGIFDEAQTNINEALGVPAKK